MGERLKRLGGVTVIDEVKSSALHDIDFETNSKRTIGMWISVNRISNRNIRIRVGGFFAF